MKILIKIFEHLYSFYVYLKEYLDIASSHGLPSCSHSKRLSIEFPLFRCPGENILPARH